MVCSQIHRKERHTNSHTHTHAHNRDAFEGGVYSAYTHALEGKTQINTKLPLGGHTSDEVY